MAESRPGQVAEPNVTPMIDVMLVLLIIFLIATPLIVQGPVILPNAAAADPDPEQPRDLIVGLDRTGRLYLDGRVVTDTTLRQQLARAFAGEAEERLLYLKADAGLGYGRVQEVIELAREAGVRTVAAVTAIQPSRSE